MTTVLAAVLLTADTALTCNLTCALRRAKGKSQVHLDCGNAPRRLVVNTPSRSGKREQALSERWKHNQPTEGSETQGNAQPWKADWATARAARLPGHTLTQRRRNIAYPSSSALSDVKR